MSNADRDKWNQRYAEGAYAERTHPSALLEAWADRVVPGKALDVACGAGRNALWLAERGFDVDGVDIAANGLASARRAAEERALSVNLIEHDLDDPLELVTDYQLILMIRYVDFPLLRQLVNHLAPGGWLICEQHMVSDAEVIGPGNPAFRVAPGALAAAAPGLAIESVEEGVFTEPDGRLAALSRLVARRPPVHR
ncbi:MAG: methyltransferase domain-containing protein [Halieaceae bacterium]|jgi:SAM-dependent methyltransferase|nr:methyltransferase domain-containing protein [Halieaceae bacterium]